MIWDVIDNKSKLIFKNIINKNNVNNAQEYLNAILADNVRGIILKIFGSKNIALKFFPNYPPPNFFYRHVDSSGDEPMRMSR